MNHQTDSQLLRAYADRRSESAFNELVRRHVGLVYSAAQRIVCDAHLAQDVTQGVFLALAKNAGDLKNRPVLSGWLHRATQNIAAQTVRTDVRRRALEQQAAAMNLLLSAEAETPWERIAPHLDAAMGELGESDRDALMLRYFEKKTASEMAGILGISDEAAQKRVSRAVEHLRNFFANHGVTVGASGLVVLISANAVQAAPAGLPAAITTAAAAGTAIGATTTATIENIAMTTLQKTFVAAALAIAVGAGIYQAHQAANLRTQVRALRETQAQQMEQLQSERDNATQQLAALRNDNRSNRNSAELLTLRAEVARLRSAVTASQKGVEMGMALTSWLDRVKEFKRLQTRMPDKVIPELRLLTEEDWLELAKEPLGHSASEVNLEDDAVARLVFSAVRAKAKD